MVLIVVVVLLRTKGGYFVSNEEVFTKNSEKKGKSSRSLLATNGDTIAKESNVGINQEMEIEKVDDVAKERGNKGFTTVNEEMEKTMTLDEKK